MASEVAYYTYIYAKVNKEEYQRVTGYTRASLLAGRFIAAVLAQLLWSFKVMDERELNYISLGGNFFLTRSSILISSHYFFLAQGVSFFVSIFLPAVTTSIYMWKVENDNEIASNQLDKNQQLSMLDKEEQKPQFSLRRASKLIWKHFKESYSNKTVLVSSL